jgi:plastocyanin
MTPIRLTLAAVVSLAALACGSNSSPSSPSSMPSPAPSPAPTPGGATSAVTIPSGAQVLGNRAFMPDDLDITVGTTVTWTNSDSVAHTSTSNGSGWDSGTIAPGRGFSFTFQTAGTFPYHCAIHPGMVGSVVVR